MTLPGDADDIATPEPDERASIDGIVQGMTDESRTGETCDCRAVCASRARSSACLIGGLTIAEGLPPELAQWLFARPRTYQSEGALRRGDHVATLAAFPTSPGVVALNDRRRDPHEDEAMFDLRVRFRVDAERQPIEDASVEWHGDASPRRGGGQHLQVHEALSRFRHDENGIPARYVAAVDAIPA